MAVPGKYFENTLEMLIAGHFEKKSDFSEQLVRFDEKSEEPIGFTINKINHAFKAGSLIAAMSSGIAICPFGVMVLSEVAHCAS